MKFETDLERDISIERLVGGRGTNLTGKQGKLTGTCPFHVGKNKAVLTLDTKSNTWSCSGCKVSNGTVVDFTMKAEGVSRRHALELLRQDHGTLGGKIVKKSTTTKLPGMFEREADDARLLGQVADYYADSLRRHPQTLDWLRSHGVTAEAVESFKFGFSDRTLGYRLPKANRKGGAEIRGRLQNIGIYKDTGHESLRGCVTVPLHGDNGVIVSMYGRRVDAKGVEEPNLYTSERGLFNVEAFTASSEVVVTSNVFEAVLLWSTGLRNVTSVHGLDGLVDELLDAIGRHGTSKVTFLFPRTTEGDKAISNIKDKFKEVELFKALLPQGMNVEKSLSTQDGPDHLVSMVRQAQWIGGVKPRATKPALSVIEESSGSSTTPSTTTSTRGDEITIELGDRKWRVRGLSANTSYERLRVHLFVTRDTRDPRTSGFFVDTVELYSARQRNTFVEQAAEELALDADVIKRDLGQILLRLEALQDEQIKAALEPKLKVPTMTDAERGAALDLLRDPHLLDRILVDFDRCGVVGESDNKLVGYLAATSRKLRHPLAIMIQSSSAAGKSSLMDAILDFTPPEDRLSFSAITPQSIFYMGETDIGHKVLSIAEQAGAEKASYALKVLQSEGSLTIASTGKEPGTGRLTSHEYTVHGPVSIFTSTTSIDVDDELLSRCIVLTADERPEQTRAIHERQRHMQTLDGLFARGEREEVLALHRNAQRLLRPLAVVNPLVDKLAFSDHRVRARRDHRKYLGLIEALAFLRQYQRPIKTAERGGIKVEYVEVTTDDLSVANRLTSAVVSRGADDLPPTTKRVFTMLDLMVREAAGKHGLETRDVRFTRRQVRERLGVGATQAWTHLRRLIEGEYVLVHPSRRGRGVIYELAVEDAPTTPNSEVTGANSGGVRPMFGPPQDAASSEKKALKGHRSVSDGSQQRKRRSLRHRTSASNGAGT